MLDIYIIDQIRKRQEDRQRIYERPALRLPLEPPRDREEETSAEPEPARVIVIDL